MKKKCWRETISRFPVFVPRFLLNGIGRVVCFFILAMSVHAGDSPLKNFEVAASPDARLFITHMVQKHNFSESELLALFAQVKIRPKVIQHVKFPYEQNPWYTYRTSYLAKEQIKKGVEFWNKYQTALVKAENIYGVPASIIVATIGIESDFGRHTGKYPVIDALVNLAFGDTLRKNYFRQELEEFLLLAREKHLNPGKVMGSYAGAIGQPQFMPSSYRYYAVNFSGRPPINLSDNEEDVIGSIANYYHRHGWKRGSPVAMPDTIGGGALQRNLTREHKIFVSDLIAAGMIKDVQFSQGQHSKTLILKGRYDNEYWITFHNFNVIKRYNPSDMYAMAVFQLSYFITALRGEIKHVENTLDPAHLDIHHELREQWL